MLSFISFVYKVSINQLFISSLDLKQDKNKMNRMSMMKKSVPGKCSCQLESKTSLYVSLSSTFGKAGRILEKKIRQTAIRYLSRALGAVLLDQYKSCLNSNNLTSLSFMFHGQIILC